MCISIYRNIASVVASYNTNSFFFGAKIFYPQNFFFAKIKCLLSSPKPQKLPVLQYMNLKHEM